MFCRFYNDIDFLNGPLRNFRQTALAESTRGNPQAAQGQDNDVLRRRLALESLCGCEESHGKEDEGQDTDNAEGWSRCILKDDDCSFLEDLDPHSQIPVQLDDLPWSLVAKAVYVPWCCTERYTCYPQHLASLFGRMDLARMMYEKKAADVHARDSRGNTTLMLAAASGSARTMVPLLSLMCKDEDDREKLVTARNKDGLTALHFAVLSDDPKVVELLLDLGAELNAGQFTTLLNRRFALTPLHFSLVKATLSSASIVEMLVMSGADVSLEAATAHSTEPCATFVRECSCGLCWSRDLYGLPKLLLPSSGARYDGEIESVGTALHLAVKRGVDLSAWYILSEMQHRLLLNVPDGSGYLPLHTAVKNLNYQAVKILLSFGADINAQVTGGIQEFGKTALHVLFGLDLATTTFHCFSCSSALRLDRSLERCVSLLLQQPSVNLDARDWRGQTPLHVACEHGHHAFIEHLVVCGASVLAVDDEGATPLSFASRPENRAVREKVVDVLLRCGAASSCLNRPVFGLHSPVYLFFCRHDVAMLLKLHRIGAVSSKILNGLLYIIISIMSDSSEEEDDDSNEVFAAAKAAFKEDGFSPRSLYTQSIICVSRQIRAGTPHSRREAFKSLELDPMTMKTIQDLCLM